MEVVKLPTHDEWHPILKSPEGRQLRSELEGFMYASGSQEFFRSIGILDPTIQARVIRTGVFGHDICTTRDCSAERNEKYFDNFDDGPVGMVVF